MMVTILVTGLLSVLLENAQFVLTPFITLGWWVEVRWGSLKSLGTILGPVDFALWFAALLGVQNLWRRLHAEVEERARTKGWPHTLRSVGTWANAALCGLPFSYYLVFGVSILFNHSELLSSGFLFIEAMMLSLATCAGLIAFLFDIAVGLWPARNSLERLS
jgi:hypothetical protein